MHCKIEIMYLGLSNKLNLLLITVVVKKFMCKDQYICCGGAVAMYLDQCEMCNYS